LPLPLPFPFPLPFFLSCYSSSIAKHNAAMARIPKKTPSFY
jgi:hypothetical protein